MLNEGNQIHNFISSSGSGTVINYGYGSSSSSTCQKVPVPTVPVPVPQRCLNRFETMIVPEAKTLETSASNLLILVSVLERILSSSANECKENYSITKRWYRYQVPICN
jgi:hypothetical protein